MSSINNTINNVITDPENFSQGQAIQKSCFSRSCEGVIGGCSKIAKSLFSFGAGMASSLIMQPAIQQLVQQTSNILQIKINESTVSNYHSDLVAFIADQNGIENIDRIRTASCPFTAWAKIARLEDTFIPKLTFIKHVGLIAPLLEEIQYRFLIQDVLLRRIPKYIVKKIAPGKENILDSTIAKTVRVLLVAWLFSAVHQNDSDQGNEMYLRLVSTLAAGIFMGTMKESRFGLLGSIGLHIANNASFAIRNAKTIC